MAFQRRLFAKLSQTSEIDLREQFDRFVLGTSGGIAHSHKVLLRKMRKDQANGLIECTCVSDLTDEADTEEECFFCLGEKFYWDEKYLSCYSSIVSASNGKASKTRRIGAGEIRVDYKVFYCRYDTVITYKDKIIELKLDTEGIPAVPYIRDVIYRPETIQQYRSDNGRLEYLAIFCREEDALRRND